MNLLACGSPCFFARSDLVTAGVRALPFFDIVKPWPISWADRELEGGFGIMIDERNSWTDGITAGANNQFDAVIRR